MSLVLVVNGQKMGFEELGSPCPLLQILERMQLKADRVAVEHNGEIAPRAGWDEVLVASGDRLEVVHFVGGGGHPDRTGDCRDQAGGCDYAGQ
jgi:sulfur carrier protein